MAESNREEIAKLEVLYANNPGGRVFTHLAEAYRKAGELDRARAILESGITRHPDYASAHVVLGRVLIDQGSLEAAATEFRRVLQLDPENRVALRSLGDIARSSDPENALNHYRHLHSLDPADEDLAETITALEVQIQTTPGSAQPSEPEPSDIVLEAPSETVQPALQGDSEPFARVAEPTDQEPFELPIQPIASDFGMEWHAESEEDGLPGDLARLTELETPVPASEISEPQPPGSESDSVTAPAEPTAQAEPPADRSSEIAEPWSAAVETQPEAEPWTPVESAREEEPWAAPADATSEVEPWSAPTEPASPEPAAGTEPAAETEPWSAPVEPAAEAEPWSVPVEPAAEAEPWSVPVEPAAEAEPWSAPVEPAAEAEPWSVPFEPAYESTLPPEPVESTGSVAGEDEPGRDDRGEVDSADVYLREHAAPLPEFSGFSEAADAIFRPDGETASGETASAPPSETVEPTFEQMLTANLGAGSPLTTEDGQDLPTETLAELYRTQGFFGRAAGVYRALLADSPDDPHLRALLKEVEALEHAPTLEAGGERILDFDAVAAADDELSARVAASAEDAGPPEAWLEAVESAWTGGSGAADIDDSQYAWSHEATEDEAGGVTLQEYLKTLLSWRPAAAPTPAGQPTPTEALEEETSETFSYTVPGGTESAPVSSDLVAAPRVQTEAPEPWEEAPSTEALSLPPAAVPEAAAQTQAEPARAAPTPAFPVPKRSTGNPVEDAFEEWFGGGESATEITVAAPPESSRAPAASAPAAVEDEEEEPDDDLEVFRSWLQSLKR